LRIERNRWHRTAGLTRGWQWHFLVPAETRPVWVGRRPGAAPQPGVGRPAGEGFVREGSLVGSGLSRLVWGRLGVLVLGFDCPYSLQYTFLVVGATSLKGYMCGKFSWLYRLGDTGYT